MNDDESSCIVYIIVFISMLFIFDKLFKTHYLLYLIGIILLITIICFTVTKLKSRKNKSNSTSTVEDDIKDSLLTESRFNMHNSPIWHIDYNTHGIDNDNCSFRVAGVSYRQQAIEDYCIKEDLDEEDKYDGYSDEDILEEMDYDEYYYEYGSVFIASNDIKLKEEPDNPYDPNAIMVLLDNKHIGYVPRIITNKVLPILKNEYGYNMYARIVGGNCKYIDYCTDEIVTEKLDLGVSVYISINRINEEEID